MKRRFFAVLLTLILFFGLLIGGMALFETFRPSPKTSDFYTDGLYLKYKLHWGYPMGGDGGYGWITLNVRNGSIYLNATIPHFYPGYPENKPLYRELILNHSGDNVYYGGKRVMLPFFYTGGNIVSKYKGNYTRIDQRVDEYNTLQGGIINFQRVYFLYTKDHILFDNGSLWNENDPGTYEYGYNTNLLFFMDCSVADDPIISRMMNITYPDTSGGTLFYVTVQFGLSLHETNLNLGPVDYFSLVLTFLLLGLPVIIIITIPATIVIIYRWIKNRNEVKE